MNDITSYDLIIVGGGVVGSSLAYGLARAGQRVLLLDGADSDYRAARGNFGLVWVQGKGFNHPEYQWLSRHSASMWPDFAQQLSAETGIDLAYENKGGFHFCLGEKEWEQRRALLQKWHEQLPDEPVDTTMLSRAELIQRLPEVEFGPDVSGASYGALDGHVDPLALLRALQLAFLKNGGTLHSNTYVSHIEQRMGGGFKVRANEKQYEAAQVVITAGLGTETLAQQVGMNVPVRPERGQLLVTERLAPFLGFPASGIRQTSQGTVMIGVTNESVGFELNTTVEKASVMAHRAISIIPRLRQARWVRHWSCLRVLTPDSLPVYAESELCPGAWVAACHSGITLAAFHADTLAHYIGSASLGAELSKFHYGRFNVQADY